MNQATKKEMGKHTKRHHKECGHWEGRYWCDCCVRGWRLWLGRKLRGLKSMEDIDGSNGLFVEEYPNHDKKKDL